MNPSNLNTSDIIAFFALVVSFVAITWNIVRDLIIDRIELYLEATAGEIIPMAGIPNRAAFVDAGAMPERTISQPRIAFTITNTGRRPIVVSKICGKYTNPVQPTNPMWLLTTRDLPKMLQPYERHIETAEELAFIQEIRNNNISEIWVEDTAYKKWYISPKNMERLKQTVAALHLSSE